VGLHRVQTQEQLTLVLDDFDGEVFLAESEELQVAEGRLLGLGLSSMSIDLDTEVVALVLEVEFALPSIPS
jgi:hypothetical protein